MATIRRRNTLWQVQVRRRGHSPLSRSFRFKSDAELWARQIEAGHDRGDLPVDRRKLRSVTLRQLLERYLREIVPRKRSGNREVYMLRTMLRHSIADLSLLSLTSAEIARFRDERLTLVKPDSVRRELAVLRHCLAVARNEWAVALPTNPVQQIKLPRAGLRRERRASPSELHRLLKACEARKSQWLPTLIELAVETGMRRSELLSMRWQDMDLTAQTVRLRITKNGEPRTVPLSSRAVALLETTQREGDLVFDVSGNAVRLAWERLRRRAGVSGLRFHDLRHEAVSRFFEKGLNVPEVAMISGHRDPRMLFRYTHPKPELIAAKLR